MNLSEILTRFTNPKYEILMEDSIVAQGGVDCYRIRALRDIGAVRAGTLGGYIERHRNLSHQGECWVGDRAVVIGRGKVSGNAKIGDHVMVRDRGPVTDCAVVFGSVVVANGGFVGGHAIVVEKALITDLSSVVDRARVGRNAILIGRVRVGGDAQIGGPVTLSADACLLTGRFIDQADVERSRRIRTGRLNLSPSCGY